jgi:hypothetical protein
MKNTHRNIATARDRVRTARRELVRANKRRGPAFIANRAAKRLAKAERLYVQLMTSVDPSAHAIPRAARPRCDWSHVAKRGNFINNL